MLLDELNELNCRCTPWRLCRDDFAMLEAEDEDDEDGNSLIAAGAELGAGGVSAGDCELKARNTFAISRRLVEST